MTIKQIENYHKIYTAVHYCHKHSPDTWSDHECNRILSATMAGKSFSWRVIGITMQALQQFKELDFKYKSGQGFTRAHLISRIQTVRSLLVSETPVSATEFYNTWTNNDKTIICARGENREVVPQYISINNEDGDLFSCEGKLAGWRHTRNEREFLRNLFDELHK